MPATLKASFLCYGLHKKSPEKLVHVSGVRYNTRMTTYSKYTFVCTGDCDALIEYTFKDGLGWPNGVVEITCPCVTLCTYLSVEDATIQPTNERNTMETDTYGATVTPAVPLSYDANVLVTYKDIIDGTATYPTIKVNELEYKLDRIKRLENQLSISNGQISKIIDNLSEESWFNPNTEKEEILNDLCEILDYQPKKEVQFEGTIYFSGRVDVPLAEYEDFDLDDFVNDITVDCYNGDVVIDEYHTEDVREC